mgnify:CR=1 FL=1
MKIILASKSPRRKELLSTIFEEFECLPSTKEEKVDKKLNYKKLAEILSEQKAEDIFSQTNGDRTVIGSDTMVILKNKIYGKPKDENDAFNMLKSLSGKTHIVVTGLCVIKEQNGVKQKILTNVVSRVTFLNLSDKEILDYIKTGEPMDKAGSYGCQGISKKFIKKINGDFFAVMGLPVSTTYQICKKLNII